MLTSKEQKLKDYIIKTGHSTDCAASVFWAMNPETIQPFMEKNKMIDYTNKSNKLKILETVLISIENDNKNNNVLDDTTL